MTRPTTKHTIIETSVVHLPPLARALRSELGWKRATQGATPGLICAACTTYAIKPATHQREPVPCVWCLASAGKLRRCSGGGGAGRGGATLAQAFIGENTGSHLILFLPLPGGSWRGRSRVVSLLLSLSSLALSRSSTSFWSCRSSLFIWVLM